VKEVKDYQNLLACADVRMRFHHLLVLLKKETEVQNVQKKIQEDISLKIGSAQKEFYLNEQLKLIQKELGRFSDERNRIITKYKDRLSK
jgi:ATP-dependent Lon protease